MRLALLAACVSADAATDLTALELVLLRNSFAAFVATLFDVFSATLLNRVGTGGRQIVVCGRDGHKRLAGVDLGNAARINLEEGSDVALAIATREHGFHHGRISGRESGGRLHGYSTPFKFQLEGAPGCLDQAAPLHRETCGKAPPASRQDQQTRTHQFSLTPGRKSGVSPWYVSQGSYSLSSFIRGCPSSGDVYVSSP